MAENEIPRWAQAALERNQRIQSKARSAVALMKLMEEQDRLSRLAPDTLGTVDPNYSEEVRYEAPGAIRDPESWLNRGLGTLAGNAADVILGRPSENPVVETVAVPEVFKLSATSTVVPYSTADKVRTIKLPIVAMTGEANVYVDTNAVSVVLSNSAAGTLDGFNFTATDDTSIAGVNVTITYGEIVLTYAYL